jgi:uncharacterized damage-inducible protein DinB
MLIRDLLLPELDAEARTTRALLERVPEDRADYRPHPKSMLLGRLAGHVAELSWLGIQILTTDSFDPAAPGGNPRVPLSTASRAELLSAHDENVARLRAVLATATDEDLQKPWTFLIRGNAMGTGPRVSMLRSWVLNHVVHHRAQLGVYLRLNDVPVPGMYGPSADDKR